APGGAGAVRRELEPGDLAAGEVEMADLRRALVVTDLGAAGDHPRIAVDGDVVGDVGALRTLRGREGRDERALAVWRDGEVGDALGLRNPDHGQRTGLGLAPGGAAQRIGAEFVAHD